MANIAFLNILLFSLVSGGLTLTLDDILRFGNLRQTQPEEPRVVEVIRWRQTVCLTPAPGVLPCAVGFGNFQSNVHGAENYSKKNTDQGPSKTPNRDDSLLDTGSSGSSLESNEKHDSPSGRSFRATSSAPRLVSPRIVESVRLDEMGSSRLENPGRRAMKRARYLRLGPQVSRSAERRQTVYVTKVVDSPIVATLVASTCLPDIGIPLCDEIQQSQHSSGYSSYVQTVVDPPVAGTGLISSSNNAVYIDNGNGNGNHGQQQQSAQSPPPSPSPPSPPFIENIVDFLNPPNVVHANQTPEVKPVIVVQPTQPPGIFDGINAFLMPNGSLFGVFNRPGDNGTGTGFPQLPQLPQLPQIPSFQQILNRPENDISDPQGILNIFNLTNQPGAGPTTASPGIFGGLFASPSRPEDPNDRATTTTPQTPSLLDGIANIFRPSNRPLVVENPNERPVIVERPIYVAELPVIPGLFDILQSPNRPVHVNSNQEPLVIKDPVYVLQRPNQGPQLFGVGLPSFNIFGTTSTTTTTTTTTTTVRPPTYHQPSHVHDQPPFPKPSTLKDSESDVNSRATDIQASASSDAVGAPSSAGDSNLPETSLAKSHTTEQTASEENDSRNGSLKEIVNAGGASDTNEKTHGDHGYAVKDISGTSLAAKTGDEIHRVYKNMRNVGVHVEIDNEA